jgi:hypothetical protein
MTNKDRYGCLAFILNVMLLKYVNCFSITVLPTLMFFYEFTIS